jgi:hypothetical protein
MIFYVMIGLKLSLQTVKWMISNSSIRGWLERCVHFSIRRLAYSSGLEVYLLFRIDYIFVLLSRILLFLNLSHKIPSQQYDRKSRINPSPSFPSSK